MCQANLDTATWVTSAVVAMPPSTRRGGLLAWTITPSQVRQAYFGKIVRFTRTKAGTTSRASRVSSPIRWSAPEQQGQTVVSGSITSSQRGRCLGSAPILRIAGRRGRSALRSVPPSSLAGGGGGVGPTARSSRSSGSWATSISAAFSDRAPKRRSFRVRTISWSFCPYRAGSRGPLSLASPLWASRLPPPQRAADLRAVRADRSGARRRHGYGGVDARSGRVRRYGDRLPPGIGGRAHRTTSAPLRARRSAKLPGRPDRRPGGARWTTTRPDRRQRRLHAS